MQGLNIMATSSKSLREIHGLLVLRQTSNLRDSSDADVCVTRSGIFFYQIWLDRLGHSPLL